ncbi:MAG: hypothetical protein ABW185_25115 [Sedimenticola sp.]
MIASSSKLRMPPARARWTSDESERFDWTRPNQTIKLIGRVNKHKKGHHVARSL